MNGKALKIYIVKQLKGIVYEAREGGYFSIDEIDDLANEILEMKINDDLKSKVEEYGFKDWSQLILAWFLVPFILIILPFAWLLGAFKR